LTLRTLLTAELEAWALVVPASGWCTWLHLFKANHVVGLEIASPIKCPGLCFVIQLLYTISLSLKCPITAGGQSFEIFVLPLRHLLNVHSISFIRQLSDQEHKTGELIGVQYLLRQSQQPLEDMTPGSDRTSELLEDITMEEQEEDDKGFIDTLGRGGHC
ncbi:hypothetical protein AALO_G00016830, partial [Alosa alosa]